MQYIRDLAFNTHSLQTIHCQSYTIFAGNGLMPHLALWLGERAYDKVFVLADTNTATHCLPALQRALPSVIPIIIPGGEMLKNTDSCATIWENLLKSGASRHTVLLNLGGGVIGDMGGFAASLFMRGIDFIQIPTTLLAMADASVGGKTGVNFRLHKNLLGMFTEPKSVWIDLDFLQTLDQRNLRAGWAEMAKHGWVADILHWQHVQAAMQQSLIPTAHLLMESVHIKKRVVEADFKEAGMRKALNFGHTFGHALESLSLERDTDPILHGEAVAAGMLMAALASIPQGLNQQYIAPLAEWVKQYFGAYTLFPGDEQRIWQLMQADKKKREGTVQGVLINAPGKPLINQEFSRISVLTAIEQYRQLTSAW